MKSFCVSPLRATAIALAAIAVPGHGRAEAPARSVAEAPASIPAELSGLETLLGRVHPPDAEGWTLIEVHMLNRTREARSVPIPRTVTAELDAGARQTSLHLLEGQDRLIELPPGGFATVRYRLRPAEQMAAGTTIWIPAWQSQAVALLPAGRWRQAPVLAQADSGATPLPSPVGEPGREEPDPASVPPPPTDRATGNAFLRNLSAYAPIYAVYGPGTNSAVRLQISFKYQLFGELSEGSEGREWLNGLHFGYTQRMFWNVEADSSPFRNIDFQPEMFYALDAGEIADNVRLGVQAGVRHESNGREGSESRSLNTIYLHPALSAPLGDGYRITFGPRLRAFAGDLSDNPDIRDYRGNTGFFAELSKQDGVRLSAYGRANLGSGKGALEANLSYPLDRLLGGGPDLYLFGQGFVGYGENLLDYDVHTTRFRVGFALVR